MSSSLQNMQENVSPKGENDSFHPWMQKQTVEYNQATSRRFQHLVIGRQPRYRRMTPLVLLVR